MGDGRALRKLVIVFWTGGGNGAYTSGDAESRKAKPDAIALYAEDWRVAEFKPCPVFYFSINSKKT